jgi:hypothetical protein
VVVHDSIVTYLDKAIIYFNPTKEYITGIDFKIIYNQQVKKGLTRISKIPYESSIFNHHLNLTFAKTGDKFSLSTFQTEYDGQYTRDSTTYDFAVSQEIIVNSVKKGKQIPKKERIDLQLPFYESVPKSYNKNVAVKFPLTDRELNFIKN